MSTQQARIVRIIAEDHFVTVQRKEDTDWFMLWRGLPDQLQCFLETTNIFTCDAGARARVFEENCDYYTAAWINDDVCSGLRYTVIGRHYCYTYGKVSYRDEVEPQVFPSLDGALGRASAIILEGPTRHQELRDAHQNKPKTGWRRLVYAFWG